MMAATTIGSQHASQASGADPAVMEAIDRGNAVVFLDVALGDGDDAVPLGRIKLELFVKDCPKTCENFRQFCTGEFHQNNQPIGYKGSTFHRVLKGFIIQGGDFVRHDGTGKTSIYGPMGFADENFLHKHGQAGVLSSANTKKDDNGCQFFITCGKAEWLDGKHVAFGKVLDAQSMLTVRKIEAAPVDGSKPRLSIRIVECGEL